MHTAKPHCATPLEFGEPVRFDLTTLTQDELHQLGASAAAGKVRESRELGTWLRYVVYRELDRRMSGRRPDDLQIAVDQWTVDELIHAAGVLLSLATGHAGESVLRLAQALGGAILAELSRRAELMNRAA